MNLYLVITPRYANSIITVARVNRVKVHTHSLNSVYSTCTGDNDKVMITVCSQRRNKEL